MMAYSINGYTFQEQIYESERTLVYRGIRNRDNRRVIIKLLKDDYPTILEISRLKLEYEISKKMDIPGIIPVLGLEKTGNSSALIREDYGGQTLQEIISKSPFDLDLFFHIFLSLLECLALFHQRGLVHRDIKPHNIVVNRQTRGVYLIDLGLVSDLASEQTGPVQPESLQGTLAYMSPEQTGRMNRSIDYRSDLYSLGVTMYEMAAGRLPFNAKDPVELVHCHIARIPEPPNNFNPLLPASVSGIILKLLSKTAEERYQSAAGVAADLEHVRLDLSQGIESSFIPGMAEKAGIFSIPQRLYGREAEVVYLLDAFDRIAEPEQEDNAEAGATLVVVGGYSGVGKTSLVNEIHRPILAKRGYFASGKFDQFKRNIPYASIIEAFTGLVNQLLAEGSTKLSAWRERILEACEPNTALISEVIPNLLYITGPLQPVPGLAPAESLDRFRQVFRNFVQVFAAREHPLVLFLDDLQWADPPSLDLIESLTTDRKIRYLMLVGAYRDNEVSTSHPFILSLERMRQHQAFIREIHLASLDIFFVGQMIGDTFTGSQGNTQELTELVYAKTGGNPFFVKQFLDAMVRNGHIAFSPAKGWSWDIAQITTANYTDNVVTMVAQRIGKLGARTRSVLKLAAAIGSHFDLETLAVVNRKSQQKTARDIHEALIEGAVVPEGESYRIPRVLGPEQLQEFIQTGAQVCYRFSHDRVQQAAYNMIARSRRQSIHLRIGHLLVHQYGEEKIDEKIFDIVGHLNLGQNLLDETERVQLAGFNLRAGRKARESAAFDTALAYFQQGLLLLERDKQQEHYQISFPLMLEQFECLYLTGVLDEADTRFKNLLGFACSDLDRAKVYNALIIILTNQGQMKRVVDLGLEALSMFGITLNRKATTRDVFLSYRHTMTLLENIDTEKIFAMEPMTDPSARMAMEILMNISLAAYWQEQIFALIASMKMVELSLQNGNAVSSAYGYAIFGLSLASFGQYPLAYDFGRLAMRLNDRNQHISMAAKIPMVFCFAINHWRRHASGNIQIQEAAFTKAALSGDKNFLGCLATHIVWYRLQTGKNLKKLLKDSLAYLDYLSSNKLKDLYLGTVFTVKMVAMYSDEPFVWKNYDGTLLDEEKFIRELTSSEMEIVRHVYPVFNMQILFLSGRIDAAVATASEAKKLRYSSAATLHQAEDIFYHSLILAAACGQRSGEQQQELIWEIQANQKQMKKWADNCPENFLHKYLLVEAELARIDSNYWDAGKLYDQAISSAKDNDYIQNAALACRLAGHFYLSVGNPAFARIYLHDAIYLYENWGARALVTDLKQRYSQLLGPQVKDAASSQQGSSMTSSSAKQAAAQLDIATVVKATNAILGEIHLQDLLTKLITVVIENAGARRVIFLLKENDDLLIKACGTAESVSTYLQKEYRLEQEPKISIGVINFTLSTGQPVIVDNAITDERFSAEDYVQSNKLASVLCVPLWHKGDLQGLIYMENELAPGVFTSARLELIKIISSQAAISLESATLYTNLEKLVAERTSELQSARDKAEIARQEIQSINDFTRKINETGDLDTILDEIFSYLENEFGLAGLIYILNRNTNQIYVLRTSKADFSETQSTLVQNISADFGPELGAVWLSFSQKKKMYFRHYRERLLTEFDRKIIVKLDLKGHFQVPLVVQDEAIGLAMFTDRKDKFSLTKEQRRSVEQFCNQIAGAIHNANLMQQTNAALEHSRQTQEEMKRLNQITKAINATTDIDIILDMLYDYLCQEFGLNNIWIIRPEQSSHTLKTYKFLYSKDAFFATEEKINFVNNFSVSLRQKSYSMVGTFYRKKILQGMRLREKAIGPVDRDIVAKLRFASFIQIPLIVENEVIAILISGWQHTRKMNKPVRTALERVADQVAGAIRTATLLVEAESARREAESTRDEIEQLNVLTKRINESANLDYILGEVFDYFESQYGLLGFILAMDKSLNRIFTLRTSRQQFTPTEIAYAREISEPFGPHLGAVWAGFAKKKTAYLTRYSAKLASEFDKALVANLHLKGHLQVPLVIQDEVVALAMFTHRRKSFRLDKKVRRSVEQFCQQIAGAIHNANLIQEIGLARDEAEKQRLEAERARQQTEELNSLIKSLNENLDLKVIMSKIHVYLERRYKIDYYGLYATTEDKKRVRFLDANFPDRLSDSDRHRIIQKEIPVNTSHGGHAFTFKTQKPFYVPNAQSNRVRNGASEEETYLSEKYGYKSFLMIPLVLQNEVIGILDLSSEDKIKLSKDDMISLSLLGEQLAGIIHGAGILQEIQKEREKSDKLLLNILPAKIAEELKQNNEVTPLLYDSVSIMFTDFKGFTQSVMTMMPDEVVSQVDAIFTQFDHICERHHLEKIKTIGDAYMCAGGIPDINYTHPYDICLAALEIRKFMIETKELRDRANPGSNFWQIRIGIHSGYCIGGVVGRNKFQFDIWSDDVNTASRMESGGEVQRINISEATYELVKDFFECTPRGRISTKGKGEIEMYFLERLKQEYSQDEEGNVPNKRFLEIYEEMKML